MIEKDVFHLRVAENNVLNLRLLTPQKVIYADINRN
jgi:hypothetical protein